MPSKWLKVAFFNFLIAGCLGALMRLAFVTEIPWINYRFIMHAHSHVAMLGWIYVALFALLVHFFIIPLGKSHSFYNYVLILTQISIVGMLVSFPFQGYGAFSIFFSSMHILLSYVFAWKFFRDIKGASKKHPSSILFVKTSLLLMILSTLAVFALAPVTASDLRQSALYYGLIQFFLHFQFNGWYIFAILAILFRLFENWNFNLSIRKVNLFFTLLLLSCFLTYTLAMTWSTPLPFLFWLNSLGVSLQLLALIFLYSILRPRIAMIRTHIKTAASALLGFAFFFLFVKIIVQTALVVPYIATIAYTIRNFVIGFIHLILLACISAAILAYSSHRGWMDMKNKMNVLGIAILFSGIILSELLLFLQGILIWAGMGFFSYYYALLFGASVLMPVGILILWVRSISKFYGQGSIDPSSLSE